MSKYQKALEIVKHPMKYGVEKFNEAIIILQELVEKEIILVTKLAIEVAEETIIDLLTDLYIESLEEVKE